MCQKSVAIAICIIQICIITTSNEVWQTEFLKIYVYLYAYIRRISFFTLDAMGINMKKIVSKINLKGETPPGRATIYVPRALFVSFRSSCKAHGRSASDVLRDFMREYLASGRKKKK